MALQQGGKRRHVFVLERTAFTLYRPKKDSNPNRGLNSIGHVRFKFLSASLPKP
jgi:hypothetical protein